MEDCVGQSRGVPRHARFANTTWAQMHKVFQDMYAHIRRRISQPCHRVIVEVALLNDAFVRGDFAVHCHRMPVYGRTFGLLSHPSGLTYRPQSMAISTWGTVMVPSALTATCTAVAT